MCGFNASDIDRSERTDTAMEILRKRFAAGEISKDQFQEIKRTLTDSTDIVEE